MFADLGSLPEFSNGLTAAQEEMFQLLEEECAEVIQAVSKIRRHGLTSGEGKNLENLHEECGDLFACIKVLIHNQLLDPVAVSHVSSKKLDRIRDPKQNRVHFITPAMVPER